MAAAKLSTKDLALLALAWKCFDSQPKLDTEKLKELAGYANKATASACWSSLRKKLTPKEGEEVKLTANDQKLLALVWQCFTSAPKIDHDKLANLAGYKNAATSSACWSTLRKKLTAETTTKGGEPSKKPAKAAVRKRATVKKRQRGSPSLSEVLAGDEAEEDVEHGTKKIKQEMHDDEQLPTEDENVTDDFFNSAFGYI